MPLKGEGCKAIIFGAMSLLTAIMMVILHEAIRNYKISFALGVLAGVFAMTSAGLFGIVARIVVGRMRKV